MTMRQIAIGHFRQQEDIRVIFPPPPRQHFSRQSRCRHSPSRASLPAARWCACTPTTCITAHTAAAANGGAAALPYHLYHAIFMQRRDISQEDIELYRRPEASDYHRARFFYMSPAIFREDDGSRSLRAPPTRIEVARLPTQYTITFSPCYLFATSPMTPGFFPPPHFCALMPGCTFQLRHFGQERATMPLSPPCLMSAIDADRYKITAICTQCTGWYVLICA